MRHVSDSIVSTVVALAAGLIVSGLVVAAVGADPARAFAALLDGAFGSADGLSEVAVRACPLMLCGLAVAVAFRAGVWNVGAEGQLLFGALAVAWLGVHVAGFPRAVAAAILMLGAGLSGTLWGWLAAELKIRRGVSEIIGTIMLNFVAQGLIGYLVQGPLMEAGGQYPQTEALPAAARLARLFPPSRVHTGVLLALGMAAAVGFLMKRTVLGFELRAVGSNPRAARIAGVAVERRMVTALALGGALAGIAGGIEVAGVTYRLYERFSPGYGFTGIAVALLGRLDPVAVVVAAFFFAALEVGSNAMQREAGVSSVLVAVVQATMILVVVGLERRVWFGAGGEEEGGAAEPARG